MRKVFRDESLIVGAVDLSRLTLDAAELQLSVAQCPNAKCETGFNLSSLSKNKLVFASMTGSCAKGMLT